MRKFKNLRKKKLSAFVLSASLLIVGNSVGQEFVQTYGSTNYESAAVIKLTSDGNYIMAGNTESFGGGLADVWLVKLDTDGNVVWQKAYGYSNYERARDVIQTPDGGYLIGGYTSSFGNGGKDFWLIKTDSDGNIVGQGTFGGSSDDVLEILKPTSDGGGIAVGYTRSFGNGGSDLWVGKVDAGGSLVWQKTYGAEGGERASSVIEVSDGYIISGHTGSFRTQKGGLWVLKLDFSGNVVWQKAYDGSNRDKFGIVRELSDGSYVLVGYTESFGAGAGDIWVLKFDSSYNLLWAKTYGGAANDRARSVEATTDGGVVIAGETESFGAGGSDAWVLKLDSNGNIEWEKTYGGTSNDYANSIKITPDNGYIIAGRTESFGAGGSDAWVLKLDSNGNIGGGCTYVGTSAAIVNDVTTLFNTINTSTVPQNTTATFQPSTAQQIDTTASSSQICYGISDVIIDPTLINFGDVYIPDDSNDETITVYNYTSFPVQIQNVAIRGVDGPNFRILSENCSYSTLGAGDSCNIIVDFKPVNSGQLKAVVKVYYDDGTGIKKLYTKLRGTGRDAQEPDIASDMDTYHFIAPIGSCDVVTIPITNNGYSVPEGLIIDQIVLRGRDSADFNIISENCTTAGELDHGDICTINVKFCPNIGSSDLRKAVIKIRNNDCNDNPYIIKLRGHVGLSLHL